MFQPDEIARSAGGAWALFKGDPQGIRRFDTSFEGFWRSFGVILLIIPALGVVLAAHRIEILETSLYTNEDFPAGRYLLSSLVSIGIDWVDYPILLALLARPLQLQKTYVPLIVALNWAQVVAVVPMTIPSLLSVFGVIDAETRAVLDLVAFGIVLRYQFMVTRFATGAPTGFAIGLVALDVIGSVIVQVLVGNLFGI